MTQNICAVVYQTVVRVPVGQPLFTGLQPSLENQNTKKDNNFQK
jgi:hypothetical protein